MYNRTCLISTPNSGGSYYFRSRIPKDLSSHFNGVTEFRLSLQCSIQSRSKRIAQISTRLFQSIYEIRLMKSLEMEDIMKILKIEIGNRFFIPINDFGTNQFKNQDSDEFGFSQSERSPFYGYIEK